MASQRTPDLTMPDAAASDSGAAVAAASSDAPALRARSTRWIGGRTGTGLKYGIAFTAPFLALYVVFVIYPVVQAVWMSFHDWDLLGATRDFLGLENYERML